jgi:hypothetical protein
MRLQIFHYAFADDRDESIYPDDGLRPLTAKAKKEMVRLRGMPVDCR